MATELEAGAAAELRVGDHELAAQEVEGQPVRVAQLVFSPWSRRIGATLPETPAWKVSTAPASGFTKSLFATMISSRPGSITTVNGSASVVSGPVMTRFAGVSPVASR